MREYIICDGKSKLAFELCCQFIDILLDDGTVTASQANEIKEDCAALCTEIHE